VFRGQNAGAPIGASRNLPECSKSENESDLIREMYWSEIGARNYSQENFPLAASSTARGITTTMMKERKNAV